MQDAYRDRIFTTGAGGLPRRPAHRRDPVTGRKDFSALVELARRCPPPARLDAGEFVGGFGRNQLDAARRRIAELVRAGAIKRFVVMGGCDGRDPYRDYYRQVAERCPQDTVILTAGCAKYRFMQVQAGRRSKACPACSTPGSATTATRWSPSPWS